MKLSAILLSFFTLLTVSTRAQNKDEQAIRAILADQTVQWNKGNIEAFMKGYWKSDSLLFVGKTGARYGYQTTLENYKKGYPNADAMGKLDFDILKLEKLAADRYFVLGKWALTRTIGNVGGYFTLIFRRIDGKWFIVVDHSS